MFLSLLHNDIIKTLNLLMVLFIFECSSAVADCDKTLSPNIKFQNISSEIIETINNNIEDINNDLGVARGIIEDKLISRIDTDKASKIVLDYFWSDLTLSQKKNFSSIFHTFLLRQSSNAIATVLVDGRNKLKLDSIKLDEYIKISKETGIIKSRVYTNETYVVVYKIHCVTLQDKSKWKVYDVVIDGVSILKQYRNQFKNKIEEDGFENLVLLMKKFNEKLLPTFTYKKTIIDHK